MTPEQERLLYAYAAQINDLRMSVYGRGKTDAQIYSDFKDNFNKLERKVYCLEDKIKKLVNIIQNMREYEKAETIDKVGMDLLCKPVEYLDEISVRTANVFKNENIKYVGDLVIKSEAELLRLPNFGRKSLHEIKKILDKYEFLYLGMNIAGWRRPE